VPGRIWPTRWARRASYGSDWPSWREVFAEQRAPRTSLNRPVGGHRRLAIVRSRLEAAKQVAHAHDAKVNAVVLTAVAGGLRELLRSRGESVDGLVLRAMVPVSLHQEQPGQARGNLDGMIVAPLPVGEADPVRPLHLVAEETAERKKKAHPQAMSTGIFRFTLARRAVLPAVNTDSSWCALPRRIGGSPGGPGSGRSGRADPARCRRAAGASWPGRLSVPPVRRPQSGPLVEALLAAAACSFRSTAMRRKSFQPSG
jgi:hypothetical protein